MADLQNKTVEELQQFADSAADVREKVDTLTELGKRLNESDLPRALGYFDLALNLARQEDYKNGEGNILSFRGSMERVKGNFVDALEYYLQAKENFEAGDNKLNVAKTNNNIGIVYSSMGNNLKALESYHKALELHEELGDKAGAAKVTNNMGVIYDGIEDYEKALKYYREALAMNQALNDKPMIARNDANIGVVHWNLKEYPEALLHFEKAIATHLEDGDKAALALNYGNIGVVYEEMEDYDHALEFSLKALSFSEEAGDNDMIAFNTGTIGNIYCRMGNYEQAAEYLFKSLSVAGKIGSLKWQHASLAGFVTLYERQNKWQQALEYYRKEVEVNNSIKREEVEKKAETMEVQKKLAAEEAVRKTTEKILHNILPQKIAERIKNGETEIIERFENCSVLFADIVGFTTWSSKMKVNELAKHLNGIFEIFDDLANQFEVEKIKTIGDAYMCVAGLPEPCDNHAERIAKMALGMNEKIRETYPNGEIRLRIGIHSGEVIAGVLGKNKYAYDLWGDTVNTASRMESHSLPDRIQVTEEFRKAATPATPKSPKGDFNTEFSFEERGGIEIKGKGKMKTWFLMRS